MKLNLIIFKNKKNNIIMKATKDLNELELILKYLGFNIIIHKGKKTTGGHATAKTVGEITKHFGKYIMTSGQFLEDFRGLDFKNDWNDLMFLIRKIKEKNSETDAINFYLTSTKIENTYKTVIEFLKD